jgi:hypothetical protein
MSRIDQLLDAYRRHSSIPLKENLPLTQRIWFLVHPPEEERRLRHHLTEFEMTTTEAKLAWKEIDLSQSFAPWFKEFDPDDDQRLEALKTPEDIEDYADPHYSEYLARRIEDVMHEAGESAPQTVFAITGLMELYDFTHVSDVMDALSTDLKGIILLFFPGERENNTYRFLGARTGWDYLATPITLEP